MISHKEARALISVSDGDRATLDALEKAVDREIASCQISETLGGCAIVVVLPPAVSPKLAHALARRYEDQGGWDASVDTKRFQSTMTLQPPPACLVGAAIASSAPAPVIMRAAQPAGKFRVLVRMPTRSRPQQALEVLDKYASMAGIEIALEVVIDSDDATMMAPDVLQRLHALGAVITVGEHKSKVEACNAGQFTDWDILILASDDMMPVVDGYAARIVADFETRFPQLDGALHYNDGYAGEKLCTVPIMGRRLYDQIGYVYHPDYQSLYCDNEYTMVLRAMDKMPYSADILIEHRHCANGKAGRDALYARNEALNGRDQKVWNERKVRLDKEYPAPWLSICIATVAERKTQLDRLLAHLRRQSTMRGMVEILIDAEGGSIGAKRQRLLERSQGDYVSFVDDDDLVAHDYTPRILNAIDDNTGVDCIMLRGAMTVDGTASMPFEHSIKHAEWRQHDGLLERSPNHLNPVRRELALQAGFPDKDRGEDRTYSKRLLPLLKTEADPGLAPLYYYFSRSMVSRKPAAQAAL